MKNVFLTAELLGKFADMPNDGQIGAAKIRDAYWQLILTIAQKKMGNFKRKS